MLTQIDFSFFRGFRKLELGGLRRVNLIVGKNNSGKTSLLEGLAVTLNPAEAPSQFLELRQLEVDLQPVFRSRNYDLWVINDDPAADSAKLCGVWLGEHHQVVLSELNEQTEKDRVFATTSDEGRIPPNRMHNFFLSIPSCSIAAQNRSPERLVDAVGKAIRRRNGEELIERTLQSVDPRIRKIRIVPSENKTQIVVDIGLSKLVPLSQVGQGTYRLVEMFSEIIGASAQVALIDEIENGIHHSCLIDVWRGIAAAAKNFNVQIFATTHSHECIEAAHTAFLEQPTYDFSIVQLFRESGEIQGRVLDKEHVTAGIAGDIDLRG